MEHYFYLYQITNLINGKIYVGVHKTKNMNDGYMGSGKVIKNAIEKYGIDNFSKKILEVFDSADMMYSREKEIVTDEFLLREDTYNLRRGGQGGFDYINSSGIVKMKGKKHSEQSKAKMGHIPSQKELLEMSRRNIGNNNNPNIRKTGKEHPASYPKSNEHKEKLRELGKKQKYEIVSCPHCGKTGVKNIMLRWHFDKCKYNSAGLV